MIVIPVRGDGESELEEWVILEFQGDIECFDHQLDGQMYKIGTMGLSAVVSITQTPVLDQVLHIVPNTIKARTRMNYIFLCWQCRRRILQS